MPSGHASILMGVLPHDEPGWSTNTFTDPFQEIHRLTHAEEVLRALCPNSGATDFQRGLRYGRRPQGRISVNQRGEHVCRSNKTPYCRRNRRAACVVCLENLTKFSETYG